MKNQKMYEADDKMISLIRDNYDLQFGVVWAATAFSYSLFRNALLTP